jgi:hypothetical protein
MVKTHNSSTLQVLEAPKPLQSTQDMLYKLPAIPFASGPTWWMVAMNLSQWPAAAQCKAMRTLSSCILIRV